MRHAGEFVTTPLFMEEQVGGFSISTHKPKSSARWAKPVPSSTKVGAPTRSRRCSVGLETPAVSKTPTP